MARGYYTEADVENLHRYMNQVLARDGAHIDAFYYCPHHPEHGIGPYKIRCHCRKPETGMFEAADRDCPVDRAHSYMIGDKWLDTQAGAGFGLHTVLVGTGYGAELYREMQEEGKGPSGEHPMDYYAKDLLAAARWILERNHHAPAADVPAIPQKSGGAFGIPELTPPIRRQTIRVRLYNRQSDAHRLYGKSLREDFK